MCPEGQEEEDDNGDEPDPTALFGVFWDRDNDPTTDPVPYRFKTTYNIPGVDDDARDNDIAEIKRDGEYTRRTAEDIGTLIHDIQRGHDHDPDLWTPGNGREDGQYGHTPVDPGPRASSLQDFITSGNPGVGVLVKARGISRGIADAAHEDLEAIRALIGEIQKYKDKAMAARQALADEADRLRTVEIVALIGPDVFELDDEGRSQRVLGGSEKVKRDMAATLLAELETLQDANSDQMTLDAEAMEIARLEGEKTRLTTEKKALEGHVTSYEGDDQFTTPDCTDADDCRAKVTEKDTEIMAVDDDLTAERQKATDRQNGIDAKRAEWEAKLAEADADVAKAEELRTEAVGLDTDADAVQDEIDAITAQEAALRGDPQDADPDNPVSLADLEAALLRCCGGLTKERLEHSKAERVQSYLRTALRTSVSSSAMILKGEAVNFTALATQDAAGNVFARATPPGTVTARDALGSVVERTIGVSDPTERAALAAAIGTTHWARVLFRPEPYTDTDTDGRYEPDPEPWTDTNGDGSWDAGLDTFTDTDGDGSWTEDTYTDTNGNGRWDTGEPLINDRNTNGQYDAEPFIDTDGDGRFEPDAEAFTDTDGDGRYDRGEPFEDADGNGRRDIPDFVADDESTDYQTQADAGFHIKGTYKGIHGTLYIDEVLGEDGFSAPRRWVFTPSIDADGGNLRGGDPNLFRYTRNSDGTYTVAPYVDYGAWLTGDTTLRLNLLAGVVGPAARGQNDYKTVDVTTPHDDPGTLASNDLLPATATYTGDAGGLAARTDSDTGVVASGHFTADVELNATFGANPTLGGTIDNFRSTSPGTAHVNPDWAATLNEGDLTSGTVGRGTVATETGVNGGDWAGVAWGTDPVLRPDGVYGGFRIDFTDGAAAGVYSAE